MFYVGMFIFFPFW